MPCRLPFSFPATLQGPRSERPRLPRAHCPEVYPPAPPEPLCQSQKPWPPLCRDTSSLLSRLGRLGALRDACFFLCGWQVTPLPTTAPFLVPELPQNVSRSSEGKRGKPQGTRGFPIFRGHFPLAEQRENHTGCLKQPCSLGRTGLGCQALSQLRSRLSFDPRYDLVIQTASLV